MAEREVPANSRILLIGDGATPTEEFNPTVCLTDNSFQVTNNNIQTETKCGTINVPGTQDTTVDFSGVILIDPADDKVSGADLFTLAKSKTIFNFKYGPALPVAGDLVYSGRGFLTSFGNTDGTNASATFEGTIQVDKNGLTQTITV